MKNVFLVLSPMAGDQLSVGVDYAIALAQAQGAHLSVLIEKIEPYPTDPLIEPNNMQADETVIELPSIAERLARMIELVHSVAKLANVPCEILSRGEFGSLRESLIYLAQVRDVLIVDVYQPLQPSRKDLIDGALFGSGRPLILVPQGVRPFSVNKIVVAWDATRSAVRAMHDALPLLVQAHDVVAVSVIDDKAFIPNTGSLLCDYLARWNVTARFDRITRGDPSVGAALLAYARRADASLLVMGAFAHGFERELMLGSATKDVLGTNLELPVFLSH
jgi:nucleotide-binding universal stress UspA family protein